MSAERNVGRGGIGRPMRWPDATPVKQEEILRQGVIDLLKGIKLVRSGAVERCITRSPEQEALTTIRSDNVDEVAERAQESYGGTFPDLFAPPATAGDGELAP